MTIGISLCIVGSLISSLGLVLQKLSHNEGELEKPLYLRWRWWSGFGCLCITGGLLDAAALTFCPLSMVAPFSALTIITNSIFAQWFLGEKMQSIEVMATVVIVAGTLTTAFFSEHGEYEYTSGELMHLFYDGWNMVIYYIAMAVNLAVCTYLVKQPDTSKFMNMFCYANMAGCMGGNQNLFLKATMTLIHEAQFANPVLYMTALLTLMGAGFQLWIMNKGLAQHQAIKYLPMYQSGLTVYGVLAGGIYFQEFAHYTLISWIFFPLGVLAVVGGLWTFTFVDDKPPLSGVEGKDTVDTEKQMTDGVSKTENAPSDEMPLLAGSASNIKTV